MAGFSITSANAIIVLTIPNLYTTPQQLIGFSADDIYDIDQQQAAETMMGADGRLSAGYVFAEKKQRFNFSPGSPSVSIFETLKTAENQIREKYWIAGLTTLTSVGVKYKMVNGVMSVYSPMPQAGRVLKTRVFEITWERIEPSPASATAY